MKGRKCKEVPSTDLLVCFPSRAHLTLMPSPASHHHQHHLKRCSTRGIGPAAGQASPMLWAKSKRSEISEPTSPKVTCAGQIKVRRHKPKSCKNWQSVMEEIEKLHIKKHKPAWIDSLGIKKDVMQFLTCLRNVRFDFRCFGSFSAAATDIITSDDEEEEDEELHENDNEAFSRTVFSKWFMVLQENQNTEETEKKKVYYNSNNEAEADPGFNDHVPLCAPPPNALLLMRCRSAPAKSWLEQKQEEEKEEEHDYVEEKNAKSAMEDLESTKKKNKNLVVMRYGSDFYKFSSDIAKETWVVGEVKGPLSRSLSSKR
ncbi:PREDICTED: uncharacterized protein LOC109239784 [Nicotiana attenuata]|uniref:Uncharacterized protein n=1 Tax=Nicotiana attenuata TaxID=49451 RepID=A0A314LAL2_NICAT|nr:PREDICTED: uncharacterized protein LOC109239784 [Nicotiana attenuata]OIT38167.1 hypothetical protein A4A49_02330 [Nicotiana attenuata]